MGIKTLAIAVLQGNRQRNQRETQSFLANKLRKPERHPGKLEMLLPQWQQDTCLAHGMFNSWTGKCPHSIDNCLVSKILDSGCNIDNLRGFEIGQGITMDVVINGWLESGEPAEHIQRGGK